VKIQFLQTFDNINIRMKIFLNLVYMWLRKN